MKMGLFELTEKLVSFPTVSQTESTVEMADFICEVCEDAGFKVSRYPYTTSHVIADDAGKKQTKILDKVNVFAVKGGNEPILALSGHMDVVPCKLEEWNSNPFTLIRIGDNYYGRGVADMKLFLATAIIAGSRIKASELKHPFALMFSSDEEIGCLGMRNFIREGYFIPQSIVIGEPTELVPIHLHKGYMYIKIRLFRPKKTKESKAHSSDPRTAPNVLELALVPVLQGILELKNRLLEICDYRFDPEYPTLNIGKIQIGEGAAKNIIAGECWIELDIRPIPGQNTEEIFSKIEFVVNRALQNIEGIRAQVLLGRAFTPAMETIKDAPIVKLTEELSKQKASSVCYNTEGGVLSEAGASVVIWGHGSIEQAHISNEYVSARWFQDDVIDMYESLIKKMCC